MSEIAESPKAAKEEEKKEETEVKKEEEKKEEEKKEAEDEDKPETDADFFKRMKKVNKARAERFGDKNVIWKNT